MADVSKEFLGESKKTIITKKVAEGSGTLIGTAFSFASVIEKIHFFKSERRALIYDCCHSSYLLDHKVKLIMVKIPTTSFISENKQKGCLFLFRQNSRGFVWLDFRPSEAAIRRIFLRSYSACAGNFGLHGNFVPSLYFAHVFRTDVGSRKSKSFEIRISFYLILCSHFFPVLRKLILLPPGVRKILNTQVSPCPCTKKVAFVTFVMSNNFENIRVVVL